MDLNASLEWRLLQGFGSGVVGRLARYKRQRGNDSYAKTISALDNNLAFLETELRLVIQWEVSPKLPEDTYVELQVKLQRLCDALEGAVNLALTSSRKAAGPKLGETARLTQEAGDIDLQPQQAKRYPYLRNLWDYLNDGSENADTFDLDLASGPNPTLFKFQGSSQVKDALDAVYECNEALLRLCKNAHSPSQHEISLPIQSTIGDHAQKEERTKEVLKALFVLFSSCNATHEVLLYVSDCGQTESTLDMFLSCCSHPRKWQETKCLPYDDRFAVSEIHDICQGLETWTEGRLFQILHEHHGLFNAHDDIPPKSNLRVTPVQSLDHFIKTGAFLRTHRDKSRPLYFFDLKMKQSLALKLANCLMAFLDSETTSPSWDSAKVFLLAPSGMNAQDRLLYVTFKSGNCHWPNATVGFADPVLLAFAKLLLEIDLGKRIDLEESMSKLEQWAILCERAFEAERAGSGLYAEAVNGCLYLHRDLQPTDEDPKAALRKAVYQRIVSRIETALAPLTKDRKRRRSTSSNDSTSSTRDEARRSSYNPARSVPLFMNDSSLPYLSKRRRHHLPMKGKCIELQKERTQNSNGGPARYSNSGRLTVFRARQVDLQDQVPISKVITDIIFKKLSDIDRTSTKFTVEDITRSSVKYSASKSGKKGAALIAFRDVVPATFQAVTRSSNSVVFSGDSDDDELSMDVDANFIGATQLHEPESKADIVADIVAIHGLNGHPYGSWLSKSSRPKMWLKDFLPADIPSCRIFIYGYKSNIFDEKTHPRHELFHQAERLNATLNNIRTAAESRRPIIFLAHSYGGLVLARVRCQSIELSKCTSLTLMLDTHRGTHAAAAPPRGHDRPLTLCLPKPWFLCPRHPRHHEGRGRRSWECRYARGQSRCPCPAPRRGRLPQRTRTLPGRYQRKASVYLYRDAKDRDGDKIFREDPPRR
ncbi:hypothetical protein CLAIMM_10599 isoform 1 [Cladophialophora immunda]|nr:hypothetical protein CLAIMM_10599 isoform 1 [Cladophialophora immunda]